MIKALITILLFAYGSVGCGAFADAIDPIDVVPNMKIEPDSIRQGQNRKFLISFLEAPPWSGDTDGSAYLIDYDWGGDDLQTVDSKYNREDDTVDVTFYALSNAKINERVLRITAGFQKTGSRQETYKGWGYFSILRAIPAEGTQVEQDGDP